MLKCAASFVPSGPLCCARLVRYFKIDLPLIPGASAEVGHRNLQKNTTF